MPAGFEAWVHKLLEKNPRQRFQRAADAAWALAALDVAHHRAIRLVSRAPTVSPIEPIGDS
jgi:hypothetical protein